MNTPICPVCRDYYATEGWATCSVRCERIYNRYNGNRFLIFGWRNRMTDRGMTLMKISSGLWFLSVTVFWVVAIWFILGVTIIAFT